MVHGPGLHSGDSVELVSLNTVRTAVSGRLFAAFVTPHIEQSIQQLFFKLLFMNHIFMGHFVYI